MTTIIKSSTAALVEYITGTAVSKRHFANKKRQKKRRDTVACCAGINWRFFFAKWRLDSKAHNVFSSY